MLKFDDQLQNKRIVIRLINYMYSLLSSLIRVNIFKDISIGLTYTNYKGGSFMPSTEVGRSKIREYFDTKGITLISVATYFNVPKQDLNDYLSGKNKSKKAHDTLTAIIEYYKIR